MGNRFTLEENARMLVEDVHATCYTPTYTLSHINIDTYASVLVSVLTVCVTVAILKPSHVGVLAIILSIVMTVWMLTHYLRHRDRTDVFPSHVHDIAHCCRYVRDKYPGLPIFLLGHSAGGHIVSLLTTNPVFLEGVGLGIDAIAGVISISGVYSPARLNETSHIANVLARSVFRGGTDIPEHFPLTAVAKFRVGCDHLVISADVEFSLRRHARDFVAALYEASVPVRWHVFENTTHFSIRHYWEDHNAGIRALIVQYMYHILHKDL
jgi:hypothetical protein